MNRDKLFSGTTKEDQDNRIKGQLKEQLHSQQSYRALVNSTQTQETHKMNLN